MTLRKQQGIMLILPAILVMGVFTVYPLFEGLRIAFTNAHLLKEGQRYIGFQNFIRLLSDEVFWISLYHSVLLTTVVVFLQFVLGLILALAMNQNLPGMSLFKSIIMASWVIPVAATVILFKFMAQPVSRTSD
jgi:ABC-type sugar transport system permease subunit